MENEMKNLMFDLAAGREIIDDDKKISKEVASDKIRNACFEILGIDENTKSEKEIKRALRSEKANELFEVIEEIIDTQIEYGYSQNEFFNQYVEDVNLKDGDKNEFYVEDDVILTVSEVNGDHHDVSMQRLAEGESYNIKTSDYVIKVGDDIRLFLTGKKNWGDFVDAVVKAYLNKVQTMVSTEFATGVNLIPVPSKLSGSGTLAPGTVKDNFDAIIEKVAAANGTDVVIMGTKSALKQLNLFYSSGAGVNWIAPSQKEAVAHTGYLGDYEGTELFELQQKYKDKNLTTAIVPNNKLYIMPKVDNKFIKFVDYGETELEASEKGATKDDKQFLEVHRRMGVGTLLTRYHGVWTL